MRKRALFSLVGALIAAVAFVSASGAATTTTPRLTRIDVSTRAAVIHYLHSIHVKAKGAVIERGLRNYAGAHCPGRHWICASTKHTVVQIAKPGGQNRFMCRSSHCVVVQLSGTAHGMYMSGHQGAAAPFAPKPPPPSGNTAFCVKTTGLTQSCVISQGDNNGPNMAGVYENAGKTSGLTQSASYTASITQQASGTNNNTACVTQAVSMDGSTVAKKGLPVTVTLQAHQSVTIKQDTNGTGTNSAQYAAKSTGACDTNSQLTQSQTLTSTANGSGSITQNEDATYSACGDGVTGDYANLCLDIEQNQTSGFKCTSSTSCPSSATNVATFTQNSTQAAVANTPAGPVNQTQSTPLCGDPGAPTDCVAPGGLVGTVNQDSLGRSTATPTQNEVQCEDAAPSGLTIGGVSGNCLPTPPATPSPPDSPGISGAVNQTQYGPVGIGLPHSQRGPVHFSHLKGLGVAHQTGNVRDHYTITQNSTQNADTGAKQLNLGQADCTTDGACTASQTTTVNGTAPASTTQSGNNVSSSINCTGSSCPTTPTIQTHPDATTGSTSATFTWTDGYTGALFLCKIDNGTYASCHSGDTFTVSCASSHTFSVEATDTASPPDVTLPATFTWEVPICPPVIDSGPAATTSSTSATFTFHDGGHTSDAPPIAFKCKIDAVSYSACSTGDTFTVACGSSHTFSVVETDTFSDASAPTTSTWSVPICPPTIDSGPTQPTTPSPDASFTFHDVHTTDANVSFQCQLDTGTPSDCSTGTASYTGLACGSHTFSVTASDQYGDTSAATTYTWESTVCFDGTPGTSAPPATLGPYTMTPFGTDSQPSCGPSPVTGVSEPAGTITFDEALNHDTVFNGTSGCWDTWSNGYTGDVYSTDSATHPNQVTITLPTPTDAFYFYAEPNVKSPFTVTATEAGGRTSGPITVNGNGGAQYFGFYGIDGATLISITITADSGAGGFAVGEFGINTTG